MLTVTPDETVAVAPLALSVAVTAMAAVPAACGSSVTVVALVAAVTTAEFDDSAA